MHPGSGPPEQKCFLNGKAWVQNAPGCIWNNPVRPRASPAAAPAVRGIKHYDAGWAVRAPRVMVGHAPVSKACPGNSQWITILNLLSAL